MANIKTITVDSSQDLEPIVVGKDPVISLLESLPDNWSVEGSQSADRSAYYGFIVTCPDGYNFRIIRSGGRLKAHIFGKFKRNFKFVAPKYNKSTSIQEQDARILDKETACLAKWINDTRINRILPFAH